MAVRSCFHRTALHFSSISAGTTPPIEQLATFLRTGKRVLFITGAGLSQGSGIPCYRGTPDAIWSNFVIEWGSRKKFKENPLMWYNTFWLPTHASAIGVICETLRTEANKTCEQHDHSGQLSNQDVSSQTKVDETGEPNRKGPILPAELLSMVQPNAGHKAIGELLSLCRAKIITQNVDGLHRKTLSSDRLTSSYIEAHGRADVYRCLPSTRVAPSETLSFGHCVYSTHEVLDIQLPFKVDGEGHVKVTEVPDCPACGNPVIPCVLFFDELYTDHRYFEWDRALKWLNFAEVMVFVGTSFSVGITGKAIQVARRNKIPIFDFNLTSVTASDIQCIVGPCNETLPQLCALVKAAPVDLGPPLSKNERYFRYARMVLFDHLWAQVRIIFYLWIFITAGSGLYTLAEMAWEML